MIVDSISGGGQLRARRTLDARHRFSKDNRKMYVSVGSRFDVSDDEEESRARAHF
jgi:hypothetical protein